MALAEGTCVQMAVEDSVLLQTGTATDSGAIESTSSPDESGAATAAGTSVSAIAGEAVETPIDTTQAGLVDIGEDETEPPANSDPKKVSQWRQLREKTERAEREAADYKAKYEPLAGIEPVRDQVVALVDRMTAAEVDSDAIETQLIAIDPFASSRYAGHILLKYGDYRDKHVYGASSDEIKAALAAHRGQGQQAPPAAQPAQAAGAPTSVLPPQVEAELAELAEYMSPESMANIRQQYERTAAWEAQQEKAREAQEIERQKAAADAQVQAAGEYMSRFVPAVDSFFAAAKIDPASDLAQLVRDKAIATMKADPIAGKVNDGIQAFADGRKVAAGRHDADVTAAINRHLGLALVKIREAAGATAAPAQAAAAAKTPSNHITGGAKTPVPPRVDTTGMSPAERREALKARLQETYGIS